MWPAGSLLVSSSICFCENKGAVGEEDGTGVEETREGAGDGLGEGAADTSGEEEGDADGCLISGENNGGAATPGSSDDANDIFKNNKFERQRSRAQRDKDLSHHKQICLKRIFPG